MKRNNNSELVLLGAVLLLLYFRKKTATVITPYPTDGTYIPDSNVNVDTGGVNSGSGIEGVKWLPDYLGLKSLVHKPISYLG